MHSCLAEVLKLFCRFPNMMVQHSVMIHLLRGYFHSNWILCWYCFPCTDMSISHSPLGCTDKKAILVGKPSSLLIDYIVQKYHTVPSRMCMVGDRLDTDIVFGKLSCELF